jgi:hypothetical protein
MQCGMYDSSSGSKLGAAHNGGGDRALHAEIARTRHRGERGVSRPRAHKVCGGDCSQHRPVSESESVGFKVWSSGFGG